eukprot:933923_1
MPNHSAYNEWCLLNPSRANLFHGYEEVKPGLFRSSNTNKYAQPKTRKHFTEILSCDILCRNHWGTQIRSITSNNNDNENREHMQPTVLQAPNQFVALEKLYCKFGVGYEINSG